MKESKKEYCKYCGKDFTSESYKVKIQHSNSCDNWNVGVFVHRFYNDDKTKLMNMLNAVGMNHDIEEINYNDIMDIFYCVVGMLRNGIYVDGIKKQYNDIAVYMEDNVDEIKNHFNKMVDDKINKITKKFNINIKQLTKKKI